MAASQIVWTPVPSGYSNGRLKISVLVAPRLSGASTLAGFPEWVTWPTARPTYSVTFQGGPRVAATVTGPAPRLDLWQRLFTKDTPVAAVPASLAAAGVPPIRSWPSVAARSMAYAEHTAALAYNPTSPPPARKYFPPGGLAPRDGTPEEGVTDIYLPSSRRQDAIAAIDDALGQGYFLGGELPGFTAAQIDFLLAELFHERKLNTNPAPRLRRPNSHLAMIKQGSDLDFHAALSSFAQYPALQRALGLVVDLVVDPSAIGVPIPSDPVTLGLQVDWPGAASYDGVYPVVAATLTKTTFRAKPSGTTMKDGFLALNTDQFGVVEIEADSSAALLSELSRTIHLRVGDDGVGLQKAKKDPRTMAASDVRPLGGGVPISTRPDAEPAPLPALRSSGFSVVQFGRAKHLHDRLSGTASRMAGVTRLAQDPFHAEDLTYGVRVDVWDETTKRWYSLCRRAGTYDVNGTKFTADDEGTVHLAHTQRTDDPTIYLHESIFNWSGYSMVVNRPGSMQETINGDQVTVGPDSDATGPVKLKTSFRATGLPKLRYGRTYRFRARTVDITGNSAAPDDPATDSSSAAVGYLRFEAVGSPLLLPTAPRTPAESAQLMVIRGNYNVPAKGDCQRHVVPPRMSQLMAEQHGLYDVTPSPFNPGGMNAAAYDEIVRRDNGTLATGGKSDPDGWGDVHYYEDPALAVPYLADVLARGVVFRGLPGIGADEVFSVDFGNPLAGPYAFRIRLINGTGKPAYNSVSRVLTVQLPPGRTVDVAYSSRINDADVDLMGVWNWFVQSGLQPDGGLTVQDLRRFATQGRLWQLTPAGTLTLSHAVVQPMTPPAFVKPVAVRKPGDTTARIIDVLRIDRQSTDHVDIQATWTQPIDDPADPGPTQRDGSAHVVKLMAPADAPEGDRLSLSAPHEFHDTLHRQVTFSAMGTSRYVEFFRQKTQVTLSGTAPVTLARDGIAPGTLHVSDPGTGRDFSADHSASSEVVGDYVVDFGAGTIARSGDVSAIADGATVQADFVPGSVTRTNTEAQQPIVVNVRSSARPSVPDVAYLVPTFGWDKSDDTTRISSTRRGNGLRAYLRRPWYSSGDGEMLGVVLFEGGGGLPPNLRQYVTLRGQDPLFASSPAAVAPGMDEFALAVHPKAGYRLAESDLLPELTATVAVAPHAVAYDTDRRMWYSDITVAQGKTYRPFIRLALARFQPNSLSGIELSPVVLAQFAQLSPDRTLSIVFDASDATLAHLTVAGTTYEAANDKTSLVKVLVQVGDPKPVGAVGWRTTAEAELRSFGGQWSGDVTMPGRRGSGPMRLVVEERERLSNGGSRLVYVDAVEI
ncbi:hypothetical protein GCM10023195_42300 [Actinoallomurus liliacearum]|uniref:Uncharacterized protein n=1 Tax=Actinoallomurus liliacearum TaxID=1080073 RepID=A0ABP8TN69_9ACTN